MTAHELTVTVHPILDRIPDQVVLLVSEMDISYGSCTLCVLAQCVRVASGRSFREREGDTFTNMPIWATELFGGDAVDWGQFYLDVSDEDDWGLTDAAVAARGAWRERVSRAKRMLR